MKKRIIILVIVLFLLFPIITKANIICNDGTVSSSCQDCHKGCCSRHGGCTNGSSSKSSSKNNKNKNSTTKSSSNSNKTTNNKVENKKDEMDNTVKENKDKIVDEDEDSTVEGPIGLLAIGATIYGIKKSKEKRRK